MAGYALIAHMFASVCDLKPGILTMTGGNCHVYANHVKQVKRQLRRKLKPMVQLASVPKRYRLEDFKVEDFQLINYKPAKPIRAAVAI